MTILYMIIVLILNIADVSSLAVADINGFFNSSLSGEAIFWYGLIIVFLIDLLPGSN